MEGFEEETVGGFRFSSVARFSEISENIDSWGLLLVDVGCPRGWRPGHDGRRSNALQLRSRQQHGRHRSRQKAKSGVGWDSKDEKDTINGVG